MEKLLLAIIFVLITAQLQATTIDRFIKKIKLPSGETVVVAEGDYEARSVGSFSVRLYEPAVLTDETTFFISGLIHSRDGSLEKIILEDLNDNLQPEIIVVSRSVATGNFLSAYVFEFLNNKLLFKISKEGVVPDSNLINILKEDFKGK